mgnify:CR=1 FL=1
MHEIEAHPGTKEPIGVELRERVVELGVDGHFRRRRHAERQHRVLDRNRVESDRSRIAEEVGVSVDKTWHQRSTVEINDAGVRAQEPREILFAPRRDDRVAAHPDGPCNRSCRIHGEHRPSGQDHRSRLNGLQS